MDKINFVNNAQPALNATNLNQLQDNIESAIESATPTITYDTEMSDVSENGVQNKVIKEYVDNIKVSKEYILYDNPSGTKTNFVLNDDYLNYDTIKILGTRQDGVCSGSTEFLTAFNNRPVITLTFWNGSNLTLYNSTMSFSNNNVSISGGAIAWNTTGTVVGVGSSNEIFITRVIGYKAEV